MNYRHAYHAGNFADVVKHALLVALLESMKQKEAPLSYFESHAGAGSYDLNAIEASKTGEHFDGIGRLLGAHRLPASLHVYMNLVRVLNAKAPAGTLRHYPGSPLIASLLLREQDKIGLCEIQDAEIASLRREFRHDARVAVHQRDGYEAMKALLPPTPRRGLLLIDPPFEAQEGEYSQIQRAVAASLKRWATGVYAVWYPIKLRQHVAPFHRWLKQCGAEKVLIAELCVHPDNSALRLNGCGVAILNTPFRLDKTAEEILSVLAKHLSQGRYGTQRVEWLVKE